MFLLSGIVFSRRWILASLQSGHRLHLYCFCSFYKNAEAAKCIVRLDNCTIFFNGSLRQAFDKI